MASAHLELPGGSSRREVGEEGESEEADFFAESLATAAVASLLPKIRGSAGSCLRDGTDSISQVTDRTVFVSSRSWMRERAKRLGRDLRLTVTFCSPPRVSQSDRGEREEYHHSV
jgi:hypothetical protein